MVSLECLLTVSLVPRLPGNLSDGFLDREMVTHESDDGAQDDQLVSMIACTHCKQKVHSADPGLVLRCQTGPVEVRVYPRGLQHPERLP